jgi:hypothetical protein
MLSVFDGYVDASVRTEAKELERLECGVAA